MTLNEQHSSEWFTRAQAAIPGGVNSPVRAYGSVGGVPPFLASGKGAFITDVDGNEYLDMVCGWGPMLLGHGHPEVIGAVQEAVSRGLSFGASSTVEVELAEEIARRVEPIEQVRLVSTGTEATMTAIRLARGYTGRDLVVKFAGCYHGHSDGLLAAAGSGLATLALPGSAGVPEAITSQTIVVPYNDLDAVRAVFAEHPGKVAAVITEAAPANMGIVEPDAGFNRSLAEIVHEHGALLICDEVLTGFRTGPAGWWGEEQSGRSLGGPEVSGGWTADIYTFGKVIGGGMPVAALGSTREIMAKLAPQGPVYQAGTLSGNPIAVTAGLATMRLADAGVYEAVDAAANSIAGMVCSAFDEVGLAYSMQRVGNLFSFAFGDGEALGWTGTKGGPRNEAEVKKQETWRYPAFFHAMLEGGVSLPPSAFEAWFCSAEHGDRAMERMEAALPAAARAAAAATAA